MARTTQTNLNMKEEDRQAVSETQPKVVFINVPNGVYSTWNALFQFLVDAIQGKRNTISSNRNAQRYIKQSFDNALYCMYKNWEIKGRKPQSADEPVEWEAWFTTRFIEECLLRYKAGDWGDTRAYLQVGVLNHFEAVTMGFSLVARDSGRKGSALEIVRRSRLALELLNVLEDEEDSESNVVATDVESGPRKRHAKEGINADSNLAQTLFKILAENVLEPIRQQHMPSMKDIDEIVAYVEEHQDEDELWSDPGFEDAELFDYYRRELLPYIRDVWLETMIEWERGKTADILKKFKNCVKKLALRWSGQ